MFGPRSIAIKTAGCRTGNALGAGRAWPEATDTGRRRCCSLWRARPSSTRPGSTATPTEASIWHCGGCIATRWSSPASICTPAFARSPRRASSAAWKSSSPRTRPAATTRSMRRRCGGGLPIAVSGSNPSPRCCRAWMASPRRAFCTARPSMPPGLCSKCMSPAPRPSPPRRARRGTAGNGGGSARSNRAALCSRPSRGVWTKPRPRWRGRWPQRSGSRSRTERKRCGARPATSAT
jgi:hypothetical protein